MSMSAVDDKAAVAVEGARVSCVVSFSVMSCLTDCWMPRLSVGWS
ncbi:Uncharacterised protein [Mobiluncus mulieris]|nr:Uncharacterised protein [Mobiluncus mulieris]